MSHPIEHEELQRRAARLAVAPPTAEPDDVVDVLGFTWADDRFLVPTTHVRETLKTDTVASVPGAGPPLLGLVTVRAQAIPVIDPHALVGQATASRPVRAVVVLEQGDRPSLALAAEELERLARLRDRDLHAPADPVTAVRAVTSDGAILLDADALLDLPPFFAISEGSSR